MVSLWCIVQRYLFMRITWWRASKRNLLAEGNELPPKHALNQQTTLDHGKALIIANFSISLRSQRSLNFMIISKHFSSWSLKLCLNSWVCCHATTPSPLLNSASKITSVAPEKSGYEWRVLSVGREKKINTLFLLIQGIKRLKYIL